MGVDTSLFTPSTDKNPALRQELGIPQNAFVLLSVGELNKNKNHRVVIEALHQLKNSNLYYVICGAGKLKEEYTHLIRKYGLEQQVLLVGFVNEVKDFYQMADAVINPSFREGLPAAVMEAMACKIPVLASHIRGHIDLLPQSHLLFNPYNADEIARCLKDIMEHYPTQEIEQNFKQLDFFSFSSIVANMNTIYTQIMQMESSK